MMTPSRICWGARLHQRQESRPRLRWNWKKLSNIWRWVRSGRSRSQEDPSRRRTGTSSSWRKVFVMLNSRTTHRCHRVLKWLRAPRIPSQMSQMDCVLYRRRRFVTKDLKATAGHDNHKTSHQRRTRRCNTIWITYKDPTTEPNLQGPRPPQTHRPRDL